VVVPVFVAVLTAACGRLDFDPLPGMPPEPALCLDGWCWEFPLPQGETIYAVSGTAPDDVWAVGTRGLVMHYDGTAWSREYVGRGWYHTVHAIARDDVWIGGYFNSLAHFDGASWTVSALPPDPTYGELDVDAIFGFGPSDVWAGSYAGIVAHFDGTTWALHTIAGSSNDFYGIWGAAPNDVWFSGDNVTQHWDGATFSQAGAPTAQETVVWGASADDVWLGDVNGLLFHKDATTWSPVPTPDLYSFNAGWMPARDEAWMVAYGGYFLHGTPSGIAEDPMADLDNVFGIYGGSPTDAWAGGEGGRLFHFDGADWSPLYSDHAFSLRGVAGTSVNDVWVVGIRGTILHRDTNGWHAVTSGTAANVNTVTAFAPGHAYAGSDGGLLVWDGATWSPAAFSDAGIDYDHVWASSLGNLWMIARPTGTNTTQLEHYDGTSVVIDSSITDPNLDAVWGTSADDVWVSSNTTIWHREAGTFVSRLSIPMGQNAIGFAGSAPNDVWVICSTELFHYDGATFTPYTGLPQYVNFTSGYARSPTEAYFVGEFDHLIRWDGSELGEDPRPTQNRLYGMWGDASRVFVVGDGGAILSRP